MLYRSMLYLNTFLGEIKSPCLVILDLDEDVLCHTFSLRRAICWQHEICGRSSLSHLLTGSVIAAGFAAVTDHACLLASCLRRIS